jgi:hypothetical protein
MSSMNTTTNLSSSVMNTEFTRTVPVRCYGQNRFHLSIKHYHLKYLLLQTQNLRHFLSISVMFLQHILHCPINVFGHLALVIVYSWIMKIGKSESEYQTTPKFIHKQYPNLFINFFRQIFTLIER